MPKYQPSDTESVLQLSDVLVLVFDTSTNKYTIKWYNSSTASWEDVVQFDGANKQFTLIPTMVQTPQVEESTPGIRLTGTETNGEDLTIRENAGKIEVFDNASAAVIGQLPYNLVIPIPLLTDAISGSGTVAAAERLYIDTGMLKNVAEAYWEISYDASKLTSDGKAELLDVTDGETIDTITLPYGTTSERTRSSTELLTATYPLKEGIEVKVQVTGDGVNAADLRMARLILIIK